MFALPECRDISRFCVHGYANRADAGYGIELDSDAHSYISSLLKAPIHSHGTYRVRGLCDVTVEVCPTFAPGYVRTATRLALNSRKLALTEHQRDTRRRHSPHVVASGVQHVLSRYQPAPVDTVDDSGFTPVAFGHPL